MAPTEVGQGTDSRAPKCPTALWRVSSSPPIAIKCLPQSPAPPFSPSPSLFPNTISSCISTSLRKTREGCGCSRGLFGGSRGKLWESPGKIVGCSLIAKCYKFGGIRAPGKANLPRNLGRHCLDLVPTFCAGVHTQALLYSHETTTFECPSSTRRGPEVATTVKRQLPHPAMVERQILHSQRPPNYNNCKSTAVK